MSGPSEPAADGDACGEPALERVRAPNRFGAEAADEPGPERPLQRRLRRDHDAERAGPLHVLRRGPQVGVNQREAEAGDRVFGVRGRERVERQVDRRTADAVHADPASMGGRPRRIRAQALGRRRLVAEVAVRARPRLVQQRGAERPATVEEELDRADAQRVVAAVEVHPRGGEAPHHLPWLELAVAERHGGRAHRQRAVVGRVLVGEKLLGRQRGVDDAGDAAGEELALDRGQPAQPVGERRGRRRALDELDGGALDEEARGVAGARRAR